MNEDTLNVLGCLDVIEFLMSKYSDEEALAILATAVVGKIYGLSEEEREPSTKLFWEAFGANVRRFDQMEKEEQ